MSATPVQQPTSVHTVSEAAAGLDFSTAPSLPIAVLISGGGTLDFVDNRGGVTAGATLVAGRPYPWTIARVTGCTGSGQVQFFFDLSAARVLAGWSADQIAVLSDDVDALTETVIQQGVDVAALQGVAAVGAIYRPGATPGLNVFSTLLGAISALRVFGGGRCIIDDGGDSSAAVTEPDALNIDGIQFVGVSYQTPVLNVVEGTTFTAPLTSQLNISNVSFVWAGATAPFSVTSGNLGVTLDDYASITATPDATGPFFAADTGGNLYVDVGLQCTLATNSGGAALINLGASGTAEIQLGFNATLSSDTITGGGDQALLVTNRTAGLTAGGGLANVSQTQTGTTNPVFAP